MHFNFFYFVSSLIIQMTINVLDKGTIQHLHSGQVIVDLEAIVKELIE